MKSPQQGANQRQRGGFHWNCSLGRGKYSGSSTLSETNPLHIDQHDQHLKRIPDPFIIQGDLPLDGIIS
jgi:hypothetical protein